MTCAQDQMPDDAGAASRDGLAGSTWLRRATAIGRWPARVVSWWLIFGVRAYQVVLSPLLGGQCRFQPTCSQYFIEAVRKYGPWKGSWKGLRRIARCHPFGASGYDPP